MRILLDQNTPVPIRYSLSSFQVETAYERGWAELTNGALLAAAEESGFDVLVTTDKNIPYQQNLAGLRLALVVISTNDWTQIRKFKSRIVDAIAHIVPGSLVEVEIPYD